MEYYRQRLSPEGQEFYDAIYKTLKERGTSVSAPAGWSEDQFFDCIKDVQYDHPELFYVQFFPKYYTTYSDHYDYKPRYLYSAEETREKWDEIRSRIKMIVDAMQKSGAKTVYQQCKWIHDYMVQECTYNKLAPKNQDEHKNAYTIEGFFFKNTAVCMGISLVYKFICELLGIDTIVAGGYSFRPDNKEYVSHAWNIVCVGEASVQLDVTWDMCLSNKETIRYDYFFLPDQEMMKDHQYVKYPVCRQLKTSYFERTGTLFTDLNALGDYVEKRIRYWRSAHPEERLFLHFKVKNMEKTPDEIKAFVAEQLSKFMVGKYVYWPGYNDLQSVYTYKIEARK